MLRRQALRIQLGRQAPQILSNVLVHAARDSVALEQVNLLRLREEARQLAPHHLVGGQVAGKSEDRFGATSVDHQEFIGALKAFEFTNAVDDVTEPQRTHQIAGFDFLLVVE